MLEVYQYFANPRILCKVIVEIANVCQGKNDFVWLSVASCTVVVLLSKLMPSFQNISCIKKKWLKIPQKLMCGTNSFPSQIYGWEEEMDEGDGEGRENAHRI